MSENMMTPAIDDERLREQMVDMFQHLNGEDHHPAGQEYLSFFLGNEVYAVDILCVREIRAWESVTRIPNTPGYINGVINLRGNIVPVIDLRRHLSLPEVVYLDTTVVIVLAMEAAGKERLVSIVVDAVSDVIRVSDDEIDPPPQYGDSVRSEFIRGLAAVTLHDPPDAEAADGESEYMIMLVNHEMISRLIDCFDDVEQ